MTSPLRRDSTRFRRRIFALGAAVFGLLFVVMAPMYVDGVESDLEERVPAELAEAGFVGVSASFEGQDGTLTCVAPLTDPEAARAVAYDVWGVRAVDLDRTCRVRSSDDAAPSTTVPSDDDAPAVLESSDSTETESTSEPSATTTSVPADDAGGPAFDSVTEAIAGSPQLSLFNVLLQESGLDVELGDPAADPLTVFAPTDDAFEALPADVLGELRSDPDALQRLVRHHATAGALVSASFTEGDLEMADGSTQPMALEPPTIGSASFAALDIDAPNGVLHIIDAVLLPDDLDPSETPEAGAVGIELDASGVTLTGVVSSEAVRDQLVAVVDPSLDVTDTLMIDTDRGLDSATAGQLALLLDALQVNLVNGSTGFDGEVLYLSGTYLTEAGRDVVVTVATELGVSAALVPPPQADADDAVNLEAELNEFVADHPVLFEPGSSTIDAESYEVLDRLAVLAQQFDAVAITVEGHTDSDGDPSDNLWLSRVRAREVRDALVERGLDAEAVTWEGFGSSRPIIVDGLEDKAASRRVEFRVELQ